VIGKDIIMGCAQSKDVTSTGTDSKQKGGATPIEGGESVLSMLSPSVAMQNLLNRPSLIDMGSAAGKGLQSAILVGGQHVKETLLKGEKGLRDATHQVPRHLRNVFAKPMELIGGSNKIPVHPKSEEEKDYLEDALKKNFVFESLVHKQIFPLVQALEKHHVIQGTTVIEQGDPGDYFYILFDGECDFIVDTIAVGKARKGDSFGELALLYDAPRAATVKAATDCILYRVDQVVFRLILKEQAQLREQSKLELLKKVPFLKDLTISDMEKLADVMTPRTFTAGQMLATKKEKLNAFWLIESGTVKMTNIDKHHGNYEDITLENGDYFGEGAILLDRPSFSDIVAEDDGLAFVIYRETFEKVLGKLDRLILRSVDRKRLVRTPHAPPIRHRHCLTNMFPPKYYRVASKS
jgi:CRP-like cAMP-binding protein